MFVFVFNTLLGAVLCHEFLYFIMNIFLFTSIHRDKEQKVNKAQRKRNTVTVSVHGNRYSQNMMNILLLSQIEGDKWHIRAVVSFIRKDYSKQSFHGLASQCCVLPVGEILKTSKCMF